MSHHHNDNITHLYEGDQSKLYSGVLQHHGDVNSGESRNQIQRYIRLTYLEENLLRMVD